MVLLQWASAGGRMNIEGMDRRGKWGGLEGPYLAFFRGLNQAVVALSRQPAGGREVERLFDTAQKLLERAMSRQRQLELEIRPDRLVVNGRIVSAEAETEPYLQWIKRCGLSFGFGQLGFDSRVRVGDLKKLAQVLIYVRRHGTERFSTRQMLINKGARGIVIRTKDHAPPAPAAAPSTSPRPLPTNPIPEEEAGKFSQAITHMIREQQWHFIGETLKGICLDLNHSERHNRVLAVSAAHLMCRTIKQSGHSALLNRVRVTFMRYLDQALDNDLKAYYQYLGQN